MGIRKLSGVAGSITLAAILLLTGCSGSAGAQTGEVPQSDASQEANGKWETFDTAFASWMELYSNREFSEACTHVSDVGMSELVPGYGSTCEKALEYKQGQPFVRYIGDPEYADWTIADTNLADEETMRAAGDFQVNTLPAGKGQETADIHQYKWWVSFKNGWDHGIGAVFEYYPDEGWVVVDVK